MELTSENKKFTLLMEQNDAVLFGHLVLYHIVDAQDHQQNIQLWHSDYSNNGSKAIIDVRYVYFNLNVYSSFLSYKKNESIFLRQRTNY